MKLFLLTALFVLICSTSYGQTILLSKYLQSKNLPKSLIIIEGDRDIHSVEKNITLILHENMTFREKLVRIADICDYEVVNYDNAFLFLKKYSDVYELPCATPEEVINYSNDLSVILGDLFSKSEVKNNSNTAYIHSFLLSLSESDWTRVQSDFLPANNLDFSSKEYLYSLFLETFCGTIRDSCDLMNLYCKDLDRLELVSKNSDDGSSYLVGQSRKNENGFTGWSIFPGGGAIDFGKASIDRHLLLNISFESTTISDVMQEINSSNEEKITYAVSDSLARKPIAIVGDIKANKKRIFRCIAKIYDLKVDLSDSKMFISQKKIPIDKSKNMWLNVKQCLPFPLRRILSRSSLEPASKRTLLNLMPAILQSKTKKIPLNSVNSIYKLAFVLNEFSKTANEIRDDDMSRCDLYKDNIDLLFFKYRRNSNQPSTFSIMTSNQGKLITGVEYQIRRDVKRN